MSDAIVPVEPVLVTRALHARDEAGERRASRGRLAGVDLALGPGLHAVVGSPEDGTIALHDVVVGARAALRGSVRVAGEDPARSSRTRARIGALGEDTSLPPARTARAALRLALAARGAAEADALALVHDLGLDPLLDRRPDALAFAEERALDLALALATPSPVLVALHEPLCEVALAPMALVRDRIAALAHDGACVLVTTSSAADARALGCRASTLARGLLRPPIPATADAGEIVAYVAPPDVAEVRTLAARLGDRPEIRGVAWLAPPPGIDGRPASAARITLAGDDLAACAVALAEEASALGVTVESIRAGRPS